MASHRNDEGARAVVLVGHCGPDAWMLASMVRRAAPGRRVEMAGSDEELRRHLPDADLLLVNRKLDGSFNESSGIALIGRLAGADGAPAMMLVSNLPEAQEAARRAGAAAGFGKRELNTPRAADLLRAALPAPERR